MHRAISSPTGLSIAADVLTAAVIDDNGYLWAESGPPHDHGAITDGIRASFSDIRLSRGTFYLGIDTDTFATATISAADTRIFVAAKIRADDTISFTKSSRLGIGIVADTTNIDDYKNRARTCSIYILASRSTYSLSARWLPFFEQHPRSRLRHHHRGLHHG